MRAVGIALLLAVSAASARAQGDADPLVEAMRFEAALDYDAALAIVEREIARGAADRDRLVALHLFAGKLAAGLDRTAKADEHFSRVVALAPATRFADGTSPKITEPLAAARARTPPLRVTVHVEASAISIAAAPDPNGIVTGVAVELADGGGATSRTSTRVELPAGARALRVLALDVHGNRVWSERVAAPLVPREDVGTATRRTLRPLYARWPLWATGTVVALGAGTVFAWRMDRAQTAFDAAKRMPVERSRLEELEARGKRWALAANISFGVASTTTLIAIIMAARGSHTTTIVTARSDQLGLAISGSF